MPEDFGKSNGHEWSSTEDFVADLKKALIQEIGTIRETGLDDPGTIQNVELYDSKNMTTTLEAFVDDIGRVHVPAHPPYRTTGSVQIEGDSSPKKVVKVETRYVGEREHSYVLYLEAEETKHADSNHS